MEIEPTQFAAHINLGLALAVTRSIQRVDWNSLDRVLEIDPLSVKAHCALAYLLRRQGKFDAVPRRV